MENKTENKVESKTDNKTLTDKIYELIDLETKDDKDKMLNLDQIKYLIETSARFVELGMNDMAINFKKSLHGQSLLTLAVNRNKIEVVQLLLKAGMSPVDNEKIATSSPLYHAARNNAVAILEYLLQVGVDASINDTTPFNNPLTIACTSNAHNAMKVLLLNGADPETKVRNRSGSILLIDNLSSKKDPNETEVAIINTLKAALLLRTAANQLYQTEKMNPLCVNKTLFSALKYDASYVLSYMTKVAHTANLRGQGTPHKEADYQPHLLRLFTKNIKTLIKTFGLETIKTYFPEGFDKLMEQLNAYYPQSEHFGEGELVLHTCEEKLKTVRWFETGTNFEEIKSRMAERRYTTQNVINFNSPVFTDSTSSTDENKKEQEPSLNTTCNGNGK
jgi:hypothetical protein